MNVSEKTQKTLSTVRVWATVLLIGIAMILCFTPMISLSVRGEKLGDILELAEDLGIGLDEDDLPKTVEVSAVDLIKSGVYLWEVTSALIDMAEDPEDMEDILEDLEEEDHDEENEFIQLTVLALVANVADSIDFDGVDDVSSALIGVVVEAILVIGCMFAVMIEILVLFISAIYRFIRALITGLSNLKTPELAIPKMGGSL